MTESTARAERYERDAPVLPSYTWTVPQKPVAVRIPLAVMEKLEREAVESYRSLTSRGSEIGGLLFGSVNPGNPATVEIASYEALPCEYSTGPLYHLSESELARLDRTIEERRAAGVHAVGYFRSHTRKGLGLDAADLALLDARFAGAHDIALVVRPSATKSSVAGIFIREEGKIRSESTYLEFPLRVGQQEAREAAKSEGSVAGPRTVPAAPAAPVAPRPVVRAQIVPIASRREIMPVPVDSPAVPVPEELPAVEPEAPAPKPAAEPAPLEKPAPVAAKEEAAPLPAPKPPAAAEEAVEAPEAPAARGGKLLWIALGTMASLVLVGGLLFTSGMLHLRNRGLPVNPAESGLALRIERNAGDILLTWNRDADAIKRASRAVLSINDGPQHENVEMDLSQLRTGSIVYSPVTSDVVFEMQVTAAGQSQPVSETVRVLRTRPSPMPEQTAAVPAQSPSGSQPAAAPSAAASGAAGSAEDANAEPKEEKVALAQAVKPFRADSLAQRLRPTRPEETPDAPGPAVASAVPGVAPVNLGGIAGSSIPAPPPAPRTAAVPPAPAPAPDRKAAAPGGQIRQAELLHRRDPEYPKLARESGASGVVELMATIGTDGHVKGVQVVRGHPLLRQAAVDAVKQWIYRPTLLNGTPVETQTQVLLNFRADR